ncbi:hypothetical protein F2Q68_00007436 [Brassica cretica]|uniref:RRM domain-containing protein n=1 Tax=Brassica cretica TaxID=69181 RepID=A0A8S9L631_BRACR|nr:hypothetical protein F2Q68_00007436 [Brassica cretica]
MNKPFSSWGVEGVWRNKRSLLGNYPDLDCRPNPLRDDSYISYPKLKTPVKRLRSMMILRGGRNVAYWTCVTISYSLSSLSLSRLHEIRRFRIQIAVIDLLRRASLFSEEEGDANEGGGDFPEPPEEAKLFVRNLAYDVDSQALAMLFEQAGTVEIAEKFSVSWSETNTKPCPHCQSPLEIFRGLGSVWFVSCANCSGYCCWECMQSKESHETESGTYGDCVEPVTEQDALEKGAEVVDTSCLDRWEACEACQEFLRDFK